MNPEKNLRSITQKIDAFVKEMTEVGIDPTNFPPELLQKWAEHEQALALEAKKSYLNDNTV